MKKQEKSKQRTYLVLSLGACLMFLSDITDNKIDILSELYLLSKISKKAILIVFIVYIHKDELAQCIP